MVPEKSLTFYFQGVWRGELKKPILRQEIRYWPKEFVLNYTSPPKKQKTVSEVPRPLKITETQRKEQVGPPTSYKWSYIPYE